MMYSTGASGSVFFADFKGQIVEFFLPHAAESGVPQVLADGDGVEAVIAQTAVQMCGMQDKKAL